MKKIDGGGTNAGKFKGKGELDVVSLRKNHKKFEGGGG